MHGWAEEDTPTTLAKVRLRKYKPPNRASPNSGISDPVPKRQNSYHLQIIDLVRDKIDSGCKFPDAASDTDEAQMNNDETVEDEEQVRHISNSITGQLAHSNNSMIFAHNIEYNFSTPDAQWDQKWN